MTSPAPASRRRVVRGWVVVVTAALAVGLVGPVAWWVTRPAPDAGTSLAELRAAGQEAADDRDAAGPSASATPSAGAAPAPDEATDATEGTDAAAADDAPGTVPGAAGVAVRDAGIESLAAARVPAPVRLRVPDLGIDAAVEAVGVQDDGAMVVPAEVASVGWYRYGPAPGAAAGNAVLAGHVDTIAQGEGALFPLRTVDIGARVTVTDASGADHVYEVVGRETITKDVLPVEEIFARDGEHALVVVTCGGPYLPDTRRYRDNVVVTAVPVGAGA